MLTDPDGYPELRIELSRLQTIDTHPTTRLATEAILEAYQGYSAAFQQLTSQAAAQFRARDWSGIQSGSKARLNLDGDFLKSAVVRLGQLSHWQPLSAEATRRRFNGSVADLPDSELGRTFYNSVIRRFQGTVGVDHQTEFLDLRPPAWPTDPELPTARLGGAETLVALERIFAGLGLGDWVALPDDARQVAARVEAAFPELGAEGGTLAYLATPLIRNRRAFLVGRITTPTRTAPLIVSLTNGVDGVRAEAVVLTVDQASIVFSFARSYFQVTLPHPRAAVGFLHTILPTKRVDELYTVLGYYRHGKREFYQTLQRTLAEPAARFVPIEGVRGMVMLAFILPPMNAVFKVIRDRSHPPKEVTRDEVLDRYGFVFLQDHGGRLADTQEFAGLSLPTAAFDPAVSRELLAEAKETVRPKGDHLVFSHLYTERRMVPLDVYLRQAAGAEAEAAVLDFGRAIKDLAGMNIFPGDMLAKNFGVTRHGRVIFYDYDEICPLTACQFRTIPAPRSYEDEVAAEPWFSVREGDIFPEEFERFLRFPDPLHASFRAVHRDLFDAAFWREVQARVSGGQVVEPAPFGPEALLR